MKRVHFPRALIARQKMMRRKAGEYTPTEVDIVAWIAELVCKSNIFRTETILSHTRRSFRSVAAEVAVSRCQYDESDLGVRPAQAQRVSQ